ncbi:MAG: hypothetical protein IJ877_01805 [Candidatus Gastranaerophilales bacterium]|nr:hypothetical protein [Candidatus Gastranaerophilales bacterium]
MTRISPLLQNQIQEHKTRNLEHEKIYEDLRRHANDVHPNAPKARLINETLSQSVVSYFKDTKQDFVNLKDTVKTGKMSDNSLGRLNDLGMKIGGLLIASFLAIHSKSANESAMRFVGTGAFFASMKLWPKIFINLPAKLIHGVDPGQRYISAQGDKKDFYLDNQFLPWDITDIKDEKEQRRHQKVTLQNRTLWMATAGAGVPIMTALMSNRLEPVVARTIALNAAHNVNHHSKTKEGLKEYVQAAPSILRNEAEIQALCEEYAHDPLNPEFAKKLSKLMKIHEFKFKDPDWSKTINAFSVNDFQNSLAELWKEQAQVTCSTEALAQRLRELTTSLPQNAMDMFDYFGELKEVASNNVVRLLSDKDIQDIISAIPGNEKGTVTFSYRDLEKLIRGIRLQESLLEYQERAKTTPKLFSKPFASYNLDLSNGNLLNLEQQFKDAHIMIAKDANKQKVEYEPLLDGTRLAKRGIDSGNQSVQNWLKSFEWNDRSFFSVIQAYNRDVIAPVRGRVLRYLKLSNPVVGSTADSVYTNAYSRTMKNLFNKLGYGIDSNHKHLQQVMDFFKIHILHQNDKIVKARPGACVKDIVEQDKSVCAQSLVNFFKSLVKDVEFGSVEYNHIIEDLTQSQLTYSELRAADVVANRENISFIEKRGIHPTLDKAVLGNGSGSMANILANYASEQKTNINAIISRLAVCTNFESRLKEGLIKIDNVDLKELPELLAVARSLIYEGCVSQTVINNSAGTLNTSNYMKVAEAIYSKEAFENEPVFVKQSVAKVLEYIRKNSDFQANDKYLANGDLVGLVKDYATKLYPGLKWMKKVGIVAIILAAGTLLIQPFFGNIKKEFSKEDAKGKGGAN